MFGVPTSLINIPQDVFFTSIFPCLSVNEVLRVRRSCKDMTRYTNNFLRICKPSRVPLTIDLGKRTAPTSLKHFLMKDGSCSIKVPTTRFIILYGPPEESESLSYLAELRMNEFLHRYETQIVHLTISYMFIPMPDMERSQLKFFKRLPNLRHLIVKYFDEYPHISGYEHGWPECFRHLKTLKLQSLATSCPDNAFGELIDFCENLETLGYPFRDQADQCTLLTQHLQKGGLQKLKAVDFMEFKRFGMEINRFSGPSFTSLINELVVVRKIVCQNLNSSMVHIFHEYGENTIAPQIQSMLIDRVFSSYLVDNPTDQVIFPNITAVDLQWSNSLSSTTKILASFPSLKKLELEIDMLHFGEDLGRLWSHLPLLEELSISLSALAAHAGKFGDSYFFGEDPEQPSFLELTKLRKLHMWSVDLMCKLTDQSFHKVFRHMHLREFPIGSANKIKSITRDGIKSLLTGNFCKSIEKFPFTGWSLAGVGEAEFRKLGRRFRCNLQT